MKTVKYVVNINKGDLMKLNVNCIVCNLKQTIKITKMVGLSDKAQKEIIKKVLESLANADFEKCNPEIMRRTWEIITCFTNIKDPYLDIKTKNNLQMIAIMDQLEEVVCKSEDEFLTSLKIAIAGNMIDFAANNNFDCQVLIDNLKDIKSMNLSIDESKSLYDVLKTSKKCLYIGDNCGECVLDKLFINRIKKIFPNIKVFYAVRGNPVLNDVTRQDAIMIDMGSVAEIIETGDSAPGIVMDSVNDEFKNCFNESDVVISKGQGNFESLSSVKKEKMFFLLMAKCDVILSYFNIDKNGLVCVKNRVDVESCVDCK